MVASIGGIGTPCTYTFDGTTVTYTVTANNAQATMTYDATNGTLVSTDATSGMQSIMTK